MEIDQVTNFLQTVPPFHTLESETLQRLTEQAAIRDIPKGEVILRQRGESPELFILLQGEATAYSTKKHNCFERKLCDFYPGEYFGLINILIQERPPAEVRTNVQYGRIGRY